MPSLCLDANALGIRGQCVLCALSGGADSVALLFLLLELRDHGDIRLCAAHLEHGIRGEASRRDMRFVQALCRRVNVPLAVDQADVPAQARASHEGLEAAARRIRYAFLEKNRQQMNADVIALAHHRDDQAETVLMHLCRGGGLTGAAGIRARKGLFIRPLLAYHKRALIDYLTARGESWCEDLTNQIADTPRNQLRLNAFPALERAYPGASDALARFADIAAAEDDYMEREVRAIIDQHVTKYADVICLTGVSTLDIALVRRALHKLLGVDFDTIERVRTLPARGAMTLPARVQAERRGDRLYLIPPWSPPTPVPVPACGAIRLGHWTCTVTDSPPVPIRDHGWTQVLRADTVTNACLRTRRDGDRIHPLGMRGSKLLSDYLLDRSVPRPFRDRIPLLARGSDVDWVVGIGISAEAAVRPDDQAKRIQITHDLHTEALTP